ncbi:cohesin loading factor [Yarrowia lipolytica]|nr:cohesin loading factor [Yarrowia lipolytica]KAE8173277.1 cohesin loading factor [Yarrowia lipolytica]RDW24346.1 cohesin loading factor [Yarrowia lipolytica]RDW35727.1 cohesin loading factor [Yarrowia lipolytica]RDW40789.1 cohesin loading factor [Yarrowia lipolytica]
MGPHSLSFDRPSDLSPECRDLIIYLAHEHLLQASIVAPLVKTREHLVQYRQMLATGIQMLETVIRDANCPQSTQAYSAYILAQVLFSETECLDRVVSVLGQGMILAQRSGLSDLVLQMECLNVRALCKTSRNAALLHCNKCLDKYQGMYDNYAYHTLQLLRFDLTLDNSLPQAFDIFKSWETLPDSIPKSFLQLYGISKALDYNVGNYEETLLTLDHMRAFEEASECTETIPQVAMLRCMMTVLVALRRDCDIPVKEASKALETLLRSLNRKASKREMVWKNWNIDGTIKLAGARGSTFNIQWVTQSQCTQYCYYLLGLAALRHHTTLKYGRELLKDCLKLLDRDQEDIPKEPLPRASISHISDNTAQKLALRCNVHLYIALVNFSGLAYKKGHRSFERFVTLSKGLPEEASDDLYSMSCLVAALSSQTSGKWKKALKYYKRIESDDPLYPAALANICCINPSTANMDTLKQLINEMSPEHHGLKHAMFEVIRLVHDTSNMSSLDRQESMKKAQKALHLGMTQQLSYATTLACVDMFGSTAEKNLELGNAFRTALSESDCVWAYVIGEKKKGYLHQLGQEEKLEQLNTSVANIGKHVHILMGEEKSI